MRDTAHLSILEHGAYLLMLQHAYATEKPLPVGKALHRMLRATEKDEREAIDSVVKQFWTETPDGLVNARAKDEIAKANVQAETNRRIAVEREARRKRAREAHGPDTNRATNAEPNQTPEPDTRQPTVNLGGGDANSIAHDTSPPFHQQSVTQMHAEWRPSPNFASICRNAGLDPPAGQNLAAIVAEFVGYWITQDRQRSLPEWDHALVKHLKAEQVRSQSHSGNTPGGRAAARRAFVDELTGRTGGAVIDSTADRVG